MWFIGFDNKTVVRAEIASGSSIGSKDAVKLLDDDDNTTDVVDVKDYGPRLFAVHPDDNDNLSRNADGEWLWLGETIRARGEPPRRTIAEGIQRWSAAVSERGRT